MRAFLHVISLVAMAVAGGTVVFAGFDETLMKNVVAVAALVGIGVEGYLGATTTGVNRHDIGE